MKVLEPRIAEGLARIVSRNHTILLEIKSIRETVHTRQAVNGHGSEWLFGPRMSRFVCSCRLQQDLPSCVLVTLPFSAILHLCVFDCHQIDAEKYRFARHIQLQTNGQWLPAGHSTAARRVCRSVFCRFFFVIINFAKKERLSPWKAIISWCGWVFFNCFVLKISAKQKGDDKLQAVVESCRILWAATLPAATLCVDSRFYKAQNLRAQNVHAWRLHVSELFASKLLCSTHTHTHTQDIGVNFSPRAWQWHFHSLILESFWSSIKRIKGALFLPFSSRECDCTFDMDWMAREQT